MNIFESAQHRWIGSRQRVTRAQESIGQSAAAIERTRAALQRSRATLSRPLPPLGFLGAAPALPQNTATDLSGEAEPVRSKTRAAAPGDVMERVSGKTFTGEIFVLDGKHLVDCVLEDCTLEYSGAPMILESTQFSGCRFRFGGQAALTMQMAECFGLLDQNAPEYDYSGKDPYENSRPN